MTHRPRVFSGARPTGRQHLGNYLGAIKNYVALQAGHDCVYCIVDLHAMTTLEDMHLLRAHTAEMALDWLAAGIRPADSIMFVQSHVPQHAELHTILSMFTPLGKLTDLPHFKDKVRLQPHNINYGLVGYPVLMTADIVLYKTNLVPVGIDQESHIEFCREVVRTFNHRTGASVLVEPQMKNTEYPKVLGTDGQRKMSKSENNHIELALTPAETVQVVRGMVTDPARVRRTDAGNPDVCNVFALHKTFSAPEAVQEINAGCRSAAIGCVDCKQRLADSMNNGLAGLRERRAALAARPDDVWDVLRDGAQRARALAAATMDEVRAAIGLP
ncbi:MAG: tryptophan--tRNA ligase [Chloroflexi bacterium]|nr:MAG: tryptophan--tRNA ligase [Chloroflexota bacterium]RLT48453.1 MAG: tryptophan--tRNA ligase [Chloroflexota bacterium]